MTTWRAIGVHLMAIGMLAAAPAAAGAAGTPPPSTQPPSPTPSSTLPPVIATPEGAGPATIELVSQPPWVMHGGQLPLGLRIDGPVSDGMTINVIAHQGIGSRIGYEQAMRGESLPAVSGQVIEIPLEFLPPDLTGLRTLSLTVQSPGAPGPNQLVLPTPNLPAGVFPVEIELRDAQSNRLSSFITPVVAIESDLGGAPAIAERLNVAWVFPMTTKPAFRPDGSPDPEVFAALGQEGRIGGQAAALGDHDVPVTVAPGAETLDAWALFAQQSPDDLGATLAAFRELIGTSQMLGGPYVPIDVPSLEAGGFSAEVETELRTGIDTLRATLGVDVGDTAVVRPVNDDAVTQLHSEGVSRMIVEDRALVPREENLTPANPFQLRSERNVTAVASNTGLVRLLEGSDPPALRAQRFLAALSVIAIEQPGLQRGVVVLNAQDSPPDLDVLNAALTGLEQEHPLVEPVPVREIFDVPLATDDAGEPLERELAPINPQDPPVTPEQYDSTRAALDGYKSLLPAPDALWARGDRALLVSLSSAWAGGAGGRARAREELDVVNVEIAQFLGGIHVPVNPTITLTSRKAEIPVTFLNDTNLTLRLRVGLSSEELTFPDGAFQEIELPPRNTTFRFAIEARGSGTFPLTLTVTSPDGLLELQQTEVQVRSTFVSNVGVFLTVSAVLFLALWWGNDFRRRRRKRAAAAPASGADQPPSDAALPGAPQ